MHDAAAMTRQTIWDGDSPSTGIPPHVRVLLNAGCVHEAVHRHKEEGTESLVELARTASGPERDCAELAIYARYLRMVEATAARYASLGGAAFGRDDAHQEAATALLALIRSTELTATEFVRQVQWRIRRAVEDAASQIAFPSAVPRRTLNRVVRALRQCDGDPYAACRWANQRPAEDRITPSVFWSAYGALFSHDDAGAEARDVRQEDRLTDVESEVAVSQLFKTAGLDEREQTVIRRSFLHDGDKTADEQIAESLGITRVWLHKTRTRALAKLRRQVGDAPAPLVALVGTPAA